MEFNIESLREEKILLEKEFNRMPKKEEIEKKAKDYTKDIEDVKVEIAQKIHESKNLREECQTREEQFGNLLKELEQLEKEEQQLKVCILSL